MIKNGGTGSEPSATGVIEYPRPEMIYFKSVNKM